VIEHRKIHVDKDALKSEPFGSLELELETQAFELMKLSHGLVAAEQLADTDFSVGIAAERLVAQDLSGRSIYDRLKYGVDGVLIQSVFFITDMDLVVPPFRDVERPIRETDELFDGPPVLGVQRGADAHIQREFPPLSDRHDPLADAICRGQRTIACCPGEQDQNFVSAPPNDQVRATSGFKHGLADFLKDFVPGVMTLGVIQSLEVVEVAEQNCEDSSRRLGPEEVANAVAKIPSIEEPSEGVSHGLFFKKPAHAPERDPRVKDVRTKQRD
jgi:hypothetical protein